MNKAATGWPYLCKEGKMDVRNFSGRVVPNHNGPGFLVETEMLLPTVGEANAFADWIRQVVEDKIKSVGGMTVPNIGFGNSGKKIIHG